MDAKLLAKSKRAHSLHHSKKNPQHHSSKGGSAGPSASTGDKKQSEKKAKEKSVQGHGSRGLPSNWDRYVEEGEEEYVFESGNVVPLDSASNAATDVVAPKSKGADYAYLISEAKAQSLYSSQSVPLFDDVLHDIYQGFGPLLSIKGQNISSWIADDNFGSEDKAPPPDEATFLSLNLHALAEQLSKATLSERLFIEPDFLPPELEEVSAEEATGDVSEESESQCNTTSTTSSMISVSTGKGSKYTRSVKDETLQVKGIRQRYTPESHARSSAAKKPMKFGAEAELDMLLGSFTDNFLESERIEESHLFPAQAGAKVSEMDGTVLRDMELDDLLKETPILINENKGGSPADEAKAAAFQNPPSSSNPVTKSKLADDFDSWFDTI